MTGLSGPVQDAWLKLDCKPKKFFSISMSPILQEIHVCNVRNKASPRMQGSWKGTKHTGSQAARQTPSFYVEGRVRTHGGGCLTCSLTEKMIDLSSHSEQSHLSEAPTALGVSLCYLLNLAALVPKEGVACPWLPLGFLIRGKPLPCRGGPSSRPVHTSRSKEQAPPAEAARNCGLPPPSTRAGSPLGTAAPALLKPSDGTALLTASLQPREEPQPGPLVMKLLPDARLPDCAMLLS